MIFCFSIHFYFAYIPRRKTAASRGVSFFQVRDFCPFLAYHFVRWWWVRWCWVSCTLRAHVPLRSLDPITCYFYGERFGELLCCFPQQVYRSTILLAIHQDSNSAISLLSCTLPHFLPFCGLLPFFFLILMVSFILQRFNVDEVHILPLLDVFGLMFKKALPKAVPRTFISLASSSEWRSANYCL